jgi:hypothetical protein
MATLKKIKIECGHDYTRFKLTMSDGTKVRAMQVINSEGGVTWIVEADNDSSALEDLVLPLLKSLTDTMLASATGE